MEIFERYFGTLYYSLEEHQKIDMEGLIQEGDLPVLQLEYINVLEREIQVEEIQQAISLAKVIRPDQILENSLWGCRVAEKVLHTPNATTFTGSTSCLQFIQAQHLKYATPHSYQCLEELLAYVCGHDRSLLPCSCIYGGSSTWNIFGYMNWPIHIWPALSFWCAIV